MNLLPSTIELMEYMPPADRPDVLAIYPSWWGTLPTFFSDAVLARFPVEGNVICGGYEDVLYRADWHLLNTGNDPREIPPGEAVVDEVDRQADVLSESRHGYTFTHGDNGWTEMKVLATIRPTRRKICSMLAVAASSRGRRSGFLFRKATARESVPTS